MQTFTFDELDKRGQAYAVARYGEEQEATEYVAELLDFEDAGTVKADISPATVFDSLGYRFNEHGERIA